MNLRQLFCKHKWEYSYVSSINCYDFEEWYVCTKCDKEKEVE